MPQLAWQFRGTSAVLACCVYGVTSNTEEYLDCGPRYTVKFGGRNTASTALQRYCYGDWGDMTPCGLVNIYRLYEFEFSIFSVQAVQE